MVLEFPDDPLTYTMDLQYMFGADILVAPIYNSSGERSVYFPAGQWIDYWTNAIIVGPQMRAITAPLDILPLYVRADALIPTIVPPDALGDGPFDAITFDAYLMESGRFTLRDTDGATEVTAVRTGTGLDITVSGMQKALSLRVLPLPGVAGIERVTLNGNNLARSDWTRDQDGVVHIMLTND
jgi:alpha-D-xyloside xylohydrolase